MLEYDFPCMARIGTRERACMFEADSAEERMDVDITRSGLTAVLVLLAATAEAADPWDITTDYWSVGRTEEHWTVDERFPGTKILLGGRYSMARRVGEERVRDCDCGPLAAPEYMLWTVGGDLQWGLGESEIERGAVFFTPWAARRTLVPEEPGFSASHETLELGSVLISKDDPLGIESYVEITAARVARIWAFGSSASAWRFTVGANLSGGYAWAESTTDAYRDVSNMIVGTWAKGTATHRRFGTLYLEQRVVNGWTFSSPARGGSVSREARARFGYLRELGRCLNLELFAEKRSFNFADPDGANLYTKSKRVGVQLACTL